MNRTTLSLIAGCAALAALTGAAALQAPSDGGTARTPAAARLPVERSTLVCPSPSPSDIAQTEYTALTPQGAPGETGDGDEAKRPAVLLPAPVTGDGEDGGAQDREGRDEDDGDGGRENTEENGQENGRENGAKDRADGAEGKQKDPEPVLAVKKPGTPVTATADGSDAPGLTGSADGTLAPGWSVQQTTTVGVGGGRGMLGTNCSEPDTDFWFPGASMAEERQDYVYLTNPDRGAAVVDLTLFGKDGPVSSVNGEGITVPPHTTVPVLLSTLAPRRPADAALHVKVRTGRVGAQVLAADEEQGGDWLPAAAEPARRVVLPGIPADATSVQLVAFAPGERDADLTVRLAGKNGTLTPAGHETLHLKSGTVSVVDLGDLTRGEPGSLLLAPAEESVDESPGVVAALKVTRGEGHGQELAFIPATAPLEGRATAADNRSKGSTLSLTATGKEAVKVRVTASAGSAGGRPRSETYTVKAGTALAVKPPVPSGLKGRYGLTVERISGGTLHAARTLAVPDSGISMFTVQTLPDDRGMVRVPAAEQDLSVLTR